MQTIISNGRGWKKTVTVQIGKEIPKISLADCISKVDVCGKAQCCECLDLINYASRGVNTLVKHCQTIHIYIYIYIYFDMQFIFISYFVTIFIKYCIDIFIRI